MEEKKWKLYKHTTPNGKVYIGITSQKILIDDGKMVMDIQDIHILIRQ